MIQQQTMLDIADNTVIGAVRLLASNGPIDDQQVLAYDVAHAAAGVELARSVLDYGETGEVEGRIAHAQARDR